MQFETERTRKTIQCVRTYIFDMLSLKENETKDLDKLIHFKSSNSMNNMLPSVKKAIDEAAQILEPELANVFALQPRNMVQVGDFKQLPATVFSMETQKSGRHMSCMQRLVEKCGHPSFFLDTQYRMHPDILQFPNRMFYNSALKTDTTVFARKKPFVASHMTSHNAPWLAGYAFIDFPESEEKSNQGSVSNYEEAKCIVKLVQYLSKVYPKAKINPP